VKLHSVNVSLPKETLIDGKRTMTGIYKEPVAGRVMLRSLNLEGDGQADLLNHGGIDQAVYFYGIEHYDYWARELGRYDLTFGQFGENFTADGILEEEVSIGDVYRVGGAVVQVTQPRVPCFKLAHKMDSPRFPRSFLASGRVGFYARVLEEGEVGAGDDIKQIAADPDRLSIAEAIRFVFFGEGDRETAERALRTPALSPGWRQRFEERLAKAS
jgi:MOSC domain-containing protein YiiM